MAYNFEYPNVDYDNYNDDWLINKVKELVQEWTQLQQDWKTEQEAFQSLKNYVNSYFDNLSIQNEVNNKLDSMAKSGELSQLINPLFGDISQDIKDLQRDTIKVNESESVNWNMLSQEVRDKLVSGTVPSIGDSDIITPYIANGAVTTEKTDFFSTPDNLFTTYGAEIGKYMNINGTMSSSNETLFSGYIPVTKGVKYYIQNDSSFFGSALFCALYNTDKSFDKTVDCTFQATGLMSYTAEHDGYIRVNATLPLMYGWYVGIAVISPYQYIPNEKYLEVAVQYYKEKSVKKEHTDFISHVGSVVDKKIGGTQGYYINTDKTLASNSDASYSNVFYLEPGSYVTSHPQWFWGSNTAMFLCNSPSYTSLSELKLKNMDYIAGNTSWCTFTLQAPAYIVMNYRTALGLIINKAGDYSTSLSRYILDPDIEVNNILNGKSISIIGDSIAEATGQGGGGYATLLQNIGMDVTKLAVGGATIMPNIPSSSGIRWCISENVNNLEISDYILMEGGVNDASLRLKIGEGNFNFTPPFDTSTFYGALDSLFYKACMRFKNKKMAFLIVHKCDNQFSSPNGTYYNAVVYACKKWGIPFLDLSSECIPLYYLPPEIRNTYTVSGDGWHPNALGYETLYFPKIKSFLQTL